MDKTKLIRVYGTHWCPDSLRIVRLLKSQTISFEFIDIEVNETGRKHVEDINQGFRSVPTIIFPNGFIIVEPSDLEMDNAIKAHYPDNPE